MAVRASPSAAGVGETGCVHPGMHSDIRSGSGGLSGVTVRPRDLSVYVDLASWGCSGVRGCAG